MPVATTKIPERHIGLYRRWVGEFVVIVLGVLAALAVDSWSEERNNRVLEREYLARITEDLNRDVAEIEETINASILQARSATTLLSILDDPLADHVPRFRSDALKALDFSVPANEEFDMPVKRLVWLVARDRNFGPRRNTYDELLATGRIVVIDDPVLRTSIIEHYALIEDVVEDLQDWALIPAEKYSTFLATSTGFNAYDFNAIDDPIPLSQDAKGLPAYLRDVRRVSLRHAFRLESVDKSSRRLLALIESYTHD